MIMVTCKNCLHCRVCPIADGVGYIDEQIIRDDCAFFMSAYDFVPKSEVLEMRKYYKMHSEILARAIFAEIERHIIENCCVTDDDVDGIWKHIAELKKKYTNGD